MRRKAVLTPELLPLVIGQFISSWGEWIFDFFILIYVYDKTTSPMMIALLTIVQVAPNVALSPAAGIYVDRHERTRILFLTDLIRGAAILGILFFDNIAVIFWLILLKSTVSVFFRSRADFLYYGGFGRGFPADDEFSVFVYLYVDDGAGAADRRVPVWPLQDGMAGAVRGVNLFYFGGDVAEASESGERESKRISGRAAVFYFRAEKWTELSGSGSTDSARLPGLGRADFCDWRF